MSENCTEDERSEEDQEQQPRVGHEEVETSNDETQNHTTPDWDRNEKEGSCCQDAEEVGQADLAG